MVDRINELKALIEGLDADSPLRRQLQEALENELARNAEEADKTANDSSRVDEEKEADVDTDSEAENTSSTLDELKALNERLEKQLEEMEKSDPSSLLGKLEKLMEDDEFITASAGFLLGAVTIGAGALAVSLLKK